MTTSASDGATPAAASMWRASVFALVALTLAGCTDRLATGTTISDDYRERHPIVLREKPVILNLSASQKLDAATKNRVMRFAAEASEEGAGRLEILVPVGGAGEARARAFAPAVKAALLEGGGIAAVSIGSYPVADARAEAPLQLSYRSLRAGVATRCGQWPADLASGSSLDTWDNRPYWNFGCSYQNMIAAQVDDPRDLEAPRALTPGDVQSRMRAIDSVRRGSDPATRWATPTVSINSLGGK